ncbi:hypothetical protein GCM10009193_26620 [Shewanella aestuarii]|nr:hypothetical protein GCM10009193_26620 [Shewanella aestuarii]
MQIMTLNRSISLVFASAILVSGCNGAADGTETETPDANYTISLSFQAIVDGQCTQATSQQSFYLNEQFCAVATLKNGNTLVTGQVVDFVLPFGDATPASKLTDSNGLATAVISSTVANAGELSVQYNPVSSDTVSASRNFEFLALDSITPIESVTISASIHNATGTVTRFKVDEAVQLQATLLDSSNQGIANQLVSFSAGSASLFPATALTNSDGKASVPYTPALSELGASTLVVSANYQGKEITQSSFYEVLSADDIAPVGLFKMGRWVSETEFYENELATTLPMDNGDYKLSAGGTFGVTATIVTDNNDGTYTRLQTPTSVTFSSDCSANNQASLDSPVTTLSGAAGATFSDTSCSGNSERSDQIIATATVGTTALTANLAFTLSRQTLASLSFISAEPNQIRIKGAGGTGSSESSLVTFMVTSANGQPTAQQTVNFTLDTIIGGLSFANGNPTDSSITNAQGLVSVRVLSGTVPTPVRVVASATDKDTADIITSQSEQLTVNTGLPQQLGFSISPSTFNPEAGNKNGETVTISIYASDSFGNPAPDDTVINFTAEGGQIQPSCTTQNGTCNVNWTSANPRVSDNRVTILAYALGHETFFDTDGDNIFGDADGNAIALACLDSNNIAVTCSGNGMDIDTYHPKGFIDLGDAYRDDDETGMHSAGEKFFSATGGTSYSGPDTQFNGPQCLRTDGSCGTGQANKTYIRKAFVLTMSGSTAVMQFNQDGTDLSADFSNITPIATNVRSKFVVRLTDEANQILPANSTVTVTATEGSLLFNNYTVPNRTLSGGTSTSFTLENTGTAGISTVTVTVTTPSGVKTETSFNVVLL